MTQNTNTLLSNLTTSLQAVLGDRLTALYLFGSLVWGDFDPDISDIDLLCVTEHEMNDAEFAALHAVHSAFARNHPHWEDRLEVAYFSLSALRAIRSRPVRIAMLSPGEPFHRKETGEDWLINLYVAWQKGAVLFGPPPADLLPPVSKEEFLAAVKRQAAEWRTWIVHTRDSRPYQGYASSQCAGPCTPAAPGSRSRRHSPPAGQCRLTCTGPRLFKPPCAGEPSGARRWPIPPRPTRTQWELFIKS